MAKRDKNRSYNEWEDDWSGYSQEDSKKEREIDRRNKRMQKHTVINEDWTDED